MTRVTDWAKKDRLLVVLSRESRASKEGNIEGGMERAVFLFNVCTAVTVNVRKKEFFERSRKFYRFTKFQSIQPFEIK